MRTTLHTLHFAEYIGLGKASIRSVWFVWVACWYAWFVWVACWYAWFVWVAWWYAWWRSPDWRAMWADRKILRGIYIPLYLSAKIAKLNIVFFAKLLISIQTGDHSIHTRKNIVISHKAVALKRSYIFPSNQTSSDPLFGFISLEKFLDL